eukprot:scaffold516_cov401-Prasinococcus_capsulatus_cf.AAC.11
MMPYRPMTPPGLDEGIHTDGYGECETYPSLGFGDTLRDAVDYLPPQPFPPPQGLYESIPSPTQYLGVEDMRATGTSRISRYLAADEELPARVAYENLKALGQATQNIRSVLLANRVNWGRQLGKSRRLVERSCRD